MRDKPVSIIIPVYARDDMELAWFDEAIRSALRQGGCEVVVYNDGSPADVAGLLARKRYNVVYGEGSNRGAAHARNQATRLATRELILPLDCDDRLVSNAVDKMLSYWDGEVPVYPDISKFGDEVTPHYTLLDFDCAHIFTYVGFSSVNVLHKRDYWAIIGGWNEQYEFYEDGEYNARLFSRWCGRRLPEPLVEYRQHDNQRTKTYKARSGSISRHILSQIRRLDVACRSCSGQKRAGLGGQIVQTARTVDEAKSQAAQLPGSMNGKVLAIYVGGKGQGKHYYQGPATKFSYKVQHGSILYADPRDVRDEGDTRNSYLLVRVNQTQPAPQPAPQPVAASVAAPQTENQPTRVPKQLGAERTPVISDLPDIANMSTKQVLALRLDYETASKLLVVEKRGRNRVKIMEYLSSRVKQ